MPRVDEAQGDALRTNAPACRIDDRAAHVRGRDGERNPAEREREQHRHEEELRRDERPAAELELDPRDEPVRDDEYRHRDERRRPFRRYDEREQDRGGEEPAAEDEHREALARREASEPVRAELRDRILLDEVGRWGRIGPQLGVVLDERHGYGIGTRTRDAGSPLPGMLLPLSGRD